MTEAFGTIVNTPISFLLVTLGTLFLIISVIGNSKLWIIEINPGLWGRFIGLLLGLAFYAIAFSGSLFPAEFWQAVTETLRNQFQQSLEYFVS